MFDLPYLIGPSAQSFLAGHGFEACSEGMGTDGNPICFHSARMPAPMLIIAAAVKLFGDHVEPVSIFKALVCLIPLWAAMAIVLRQPGQSRTYLVACAALLLAPVLMPLYSNDFFSLAPEECYLYGFIALGVALLFFPWSSSILAWSVLASFTLAAIYLTKSSMLPAALVLLAGFLVKAPDWRIRILIVALFALAPVSWALFQHDASGRYSLGTSLDGINFHKGANAAFLDRYPPPNGTTIDRFDSDLNKGQFFKDEWSFNDFHMKAGLAFALENASAFLQAAARKANVMLFSLNHYGGTAYGHFLEMLIFVNMIAFRLLLWSATGICVFAAATNRSIGRLPAISFLAFIAAYVAPYIAGFGYTRHAILLVYPAVLLICRSLLAENRSKARSRTPAARNWREAGAQAS
ncbi:MAG: hypothetical protein ACLPSF_01410 [Methylocella sp.]